jgi:hypothetical protein
MEKDEDKIIHTIYSYLTALNKNEVNIRLGDRIVAKGEDTSRIQRLEKLKTIRQAYKDRIREELQKLNNLLMQEASLNDKRTALNEEDIKAIQEEIKKVKKQLKGENRDVQIERRERRQTADSIEKSVNLGEIRRLESEEDRHNAIEAQLIKGLYAAKKEQALIKKFGKVYKYEEEEIIKVQSLLDQDRFVDAAGALKKMLRKRR